MRWMAPVISLVQELDSRFTHFSIVRIHHWRMTEFLINSQYINLFNCLWFNNFSACVMVTKVQSNSSVPFYFQKLLPIAVWIVSRFLQCLLNRIQFHVSGTLLALKSCFLVVFISVYYLLYIVVVCFVTYLQCFLSSTFHVCLQICRKTIICIMASDCYFKSIGW